MDAYDKAIEYARNLGHEHGRNAAGWYAQDAFGGRVTRGAEESARRIIRMIEDGDPEAYDSIPGPDLSGQWADSLTGPQLVEQAWTDGADMTYDEVQDMEDDAMSDICDAYEAAFSLAVEDEVCRLARLAIPE